MGNLVEELGAQYVSQYFQNSMLRDDDKLYRMVGMQSEQTALVEEFLPNGTPDNGWKEVRIPASKLKNFTSFSAPALGYRNLLDNGVIKSVVQLTSIRSTRRGFQLNNVRAENLPVFNLPLRGGEPENGWDYLDLWSRTKVVYQPEFVSLKMGLLDLQSGAIMGFALNPNIAVAIDADIAAKSPWSIYFKGARVGGVSDSGEITVYNKVVNRKDVRSQLEISE